MDSPALYKNLTLGMYEKMCDIVEYGYLTQKEQPGASFMGLARRRHFHMPGFPESQVLDPFKNQVTEALKAGLANVCIDNAEFVTTKYEQQGKMEAVATSEGNIIQPDFVIGYNGIKIGVMVLGDHQVTLDTY